MKLKKILNLSSAVLMGVSTLPINAIIISPTIVQAAGEEEEATQQVKLRIALTGKDGQDLGKKMIKVATDIPFSGIKDQFMAEFRVDKLTILFDGAEVDDEMTLDDLDALKSLKNGIFDLQATTDSEQQPAPSDQEQPTATVATPSAVEQTSVAGIDIGNIGSEHFGIRNHVFERIAQTEANQRVSDYFGIGDYSRDARKYSSDSAINNFEIYNPVCLNGSNGNEDVTIEDHESDLLDLTKFTPEQQDWIAKLRRGEAVDYGKSPLKDYRWEKLQEMYQLTDSQGKHFSPQPKKLMFVFFQSGGKDYYLPIISMEKMPESEKDNVTNNFNGFRGKPSLNQVPELRNLTRSVFDALLALHQHKIAYGDDMGHSIAVDPVTQKISLTDSRNAIMKILKHTDLNRQFLVFYNRRMTDDNILTINCLKYLRQNDQSKLGRLLAIYDQLPEQDRNLLLKSDKLLAVINEKLGDLEQADQGTVTRAFQDEVVVAFTAIITEMGGSSSKEQNEPKRETEAPKPAPVITESSPKEQDESKRGVPQIKPTVEQPKRRAFTVQTLAGDCNSVNIGEFKKSRGVSQLVEFDLAKALNSETTAVGQQVAQFFQINNFGQPEYDQAASCVPSGAEYAGIAGNTKVVIEKGVAHHLDSSQFNSSQLEALARIRRGEPVDFKDCPLLCPEYANLLASWSITDQAGRHLTMKPGKIMFIFYKINGTEYYLPCFSMDYLADQTTIRDIFNSGNYKEQTKMEVLQSFLDVMVQCHQHNLSFNFNPDDILVDLKTNQVSLQRSGNFCIRNEKEKEDSDRNQKYWKALKQDLSCFFDYIKRLQIDERSQLGHLYQHYQDDQQSHLEATNNYKKLSELLPNFKKDLGGSLIQANAQMFDVVAKRKEARAKQLLSALEEKTDSLAFNTESLQRMRKDSESSSKTSYHLLAEFIKAINKQRELNSERTGLLDQIKALNIDPTNRNYLNAQEQVTYQELVTSAPSFPTAEEEMQGVCRIIYHLLNNQIKNQIIKVRDGNIYRIQPDLDVISKRLDYYSELLDQVKVEHQTKSDDLGIIKYQQEKIREITEWARKKL